MKFKVRVLLLFFMGGLVASGLTAFPLLHELNALTSLMGLEHALSSDHPAGLSHWIVKVREGLQETHGKHPFMAYGTDWLAFAHIVIAIFFIGPLIDPVRNLWVIKSGMAACVLVIPTAMICGAIRGIPFYWRLIDCSFGVLGFVPLWFSLQLTRKIQ